MLNNQSSDDSRDRKEVEEIFETFELFNFFEENKKLRRFKYKNKRLDWDEHIQMLRHTDQFGRTYRCKESTFFLLIDILWDDILVNISRSLASTGGNTPIYPELIVAAGLQYLIGVAPRSIMLIYGVSFTSAHRLIDMFLDAVDSSDDARLSIRLPSTASELQTHAEGWNRLSESGGLFYGVVGCIDGWLCCTNKPSDVTNPADYFCGHYQR